MLELNKDILQTKKRFSDASKFFGKLAFVPLDITSEKISQDITKQELASGDYDEILNTLITCMMLLRSYGELNSSLREEIKTGLNIILEDLEVIQ